MNTKLLYSHSRLQRALFVTFSIMMLTAAQAGWAQHVQSGSGGTSAQSSSASSSPQVTTNLRSSSLNPAPDVPKVILTKDSPAIRTKTDTPTTPSTSLVKIKNGEGQESDPIEWNDAFRAIQPGETILLYQNVTLINTEHILPSDNCTIDGAGYELHYTENGVEKSFILDANITFKNIKLFDGMLAWGYAVVFENDVVLSSNYSVWGGEFRTQEQIDNNFANRGTYRVNNTSITIKGGTFENIYGGSSNCEITGSTYVKIEGGTFNIIYGGNSNTKAQAIPGNTEVIMSGGTANDIFGGGAFGEVKGTANLNISGTATITNIPYGGGHDGTAVTTNTNVQISGGTFENGYIVAGGQSASVTGTAALTITGGTFDDFIICGGLNADCANTSLTISGGTFSKWIYGGGYNGKVTEKAKVTVSGGTFEKTIYGGGMNASASCGSTDMTMTGGTAGWIYGGGETGSVGGTAKMEISGSANITGTVFGGSYSGTCGSTELTMTGGQAGWLYGGGNTGAVTEKATVNLSGTTTITGAVYGGSYSSTCKSADVNISDGTFGYVYGGGYQGVITGLAKTTISGGKVTNYTYGGGNANIASCGSTEINVSGNGTTISTIFGGGESGIVIGNTQITVEGGTIQNTLYPSGRNSSATIGGDAIIILKGGNIELVQTHNNRPSGINGEINIIIEDGKTIMNQEIMCSSEDPADQYILAYKNCGTKEAPYGTTGAFGVSKVILENSFVTPKSGMAYPVKFVTDSTEPLVIEGSGLIGNFELLLFNNIPANGIPLNTILAKAADLTTNVSFTSNGYKVYKAGDTYRLGQTGTQTAVLKTINITTPVTALGTLSVKWDKTELEDGDQVPSGTVLTLATTTAINGYTAIIKDGTTVVSNGSLTAEADINLSADFTLQPLDLAKQTGDITIGFDVASKLWHYTATTTKSIPAGATAFNGIVTGTLPDNKVILIDRTAQGILTFDNAKVEAGSNSGNAITIASGATVFFTGTLEAKTADPAGTGIAIADGAILIVTGNNTKLTTSGTSGNVITQEGATIQDETNQAIGYTITIIAPGNGNSLTVKVGDITLQSGDKATEGTRLTVSVKSATYYKLNKIVATPENSDPVGISNNGIYTMTAAATAIAASFTYNPPVPPVVTNYYDVTLPAIEGVTTNPAAGTYTVEEGENFSFSLTLEVGNQNSIPVIKANGSVVAFNESNGKYLIRNINADIDITIEGIVKDSPTSIDKVAGITKIQAVGNRICITTPDAIDAQVIASSGSIVRLVSLPAGENYIDGLKPGLYIVRLGNKTVQKVMIR